VSKQTQNRWKFVTATVRGVGCKLWRYISRGVKYLWRNVTRGEGVDFSQNSVTSFMDGPWSIDIFVNGIAKYRALNQSKLQIYNCLQSRWKLSLLPKSWDSQKSGALGLSLFSLMVNPHLLSRVFGKAVFTHKCVLSENQSHVNVTRQSYVTPVTPKISDLRTISRQQLPRFPVCLQRLVKLYVKAVHILHDLLWLKLFTEDKT